ncbi:hypothetical protein HMI54_008943 [Coelomomyces lativittatus]|nr:hypothetical protein HMI54_008943 [Coelomomyces lativittatus]KAJ1512411.1 hypothetical protein HMI56_004095 [Coelomomyces lativittatus]KAJ1515609.1 hypothetical protein HMI55_003504 [Coelomomyces lativittatus]
MPFKVLNPPHGISPNEEIDELSSSVNSITLTTRSFYQGLQGSTKGCTATPKSMVNSINSNPRSSYPKLSLEVDLNASLNINMSIAQEKPPPPSVPLRRSKINKSSFIDSNASIISNQDSLQSTSSVSEAKAHTTVKVPLIKKHSKSFISGTIKNKKKSVPQLTPKMPSSPSFLSFSQRWYIIEPEDYTRLGLPSGNWVGTREISFLETREIKRQETIFELISTERDYVRDLQLVVNVGTKKQTQCNFILLILFL